MDNSSRTKNSLYNFATSIGGQLITIVIQFIVRTVFINTLGKSYLGINGLFSNILSMLSLAEMGIGSAIIFKLYDPIAKGNKHRISILMNFYKVVYRYIGLIVAVLGIILIPFLPNLIKDYERLATLNINAVMIFLLYLFNSVSSYLFFAYKSAIIKADQKEYYVNIISYFFTTGCGLLQIIGMIITRSFILFVIIDIVKTITQNMVIAIFVNKKYSFLVNYGNEKISREEAKSIFRDCGALFIYKMNDVVVKSTDNIVLSGFIGLEAVAMYSNYLIFYTSIRGIITRLFNSVGHSIGNLHTTHNIQQEYKVFEIMTLLAAFLGGTAFVGVFVVGDELIKNWIGDNWIIQQPFAFLVGLEIYTGAFKSAIARYRTSYGLFRQGWARPLAGMIINLVLSILLVKPFGISGVLIGTIAADWLTFVWYDPLILHKIGFEGEYKASRYFLKYAKYTITAIIVGFLDFFICRHVFVDLGWLSVILHIVICSLTVPLALLLVSIKTQEAVFIWKFGTNGAKRIFKVK